MIHETDITAWLGDAELTDEQREQFTTLVNTYATEVQAKRPQHEPGDYADDDQAAWIAAYEIATGTFNLHARGRAMIQAKTDAYQGAIMAALSGTSEVQAAQDAAINRMTLRKLLGK